MTVRHELLGGVNGPSWQELREASVMQRARLSGKTPNHRKYLDAIDKSVVTICVGPAGTGKTWMACGKAAQHLRDGKIDRIILSRPLVECGEKMGFFPGDPNEKAAPFVEQMMDAFADHLDKRELEVFQAQKKLIVIPLALMRGRSLPNSVLILDEAQNATKKQLRMFLTRFGKNSKVIINGDHTQSDLPEIECAEGVPLFNIIERFEGRQSFTSKPISIVRMTKADIVRHPLIQWIDETITGDYQDIEQESQQWETCRCPNCNEQLWFVGFSPDEDDTVVSCWGCQSTIEVLDEHGEFDPIGIDCDEDEKRRPTYPQHG